MSESSIVRYAPFSLEEMDKVGDQVTDLSGKSFVTVEVGENVYRFLPAPLGKTSPFRVTAMHYVDAVPGLDRQVVFACPRHELKQGCIVCHKADEMSRSPNPVDRERGKKISAGLRVYANVLNRRSGDPVVKTFAFGKMVFDQLKSIRKSPRLGGDFTDPSANGFDIVIVREGSGMETKYTVVPDRGNSPLWPDAAVMQDLIEGQPNLDALVEPVVPEQLAAIWSSAAGRAPAASGTTSRGWTPPGPAGAVAAAPLAFGGPSPQRWAPGSPVVQTTGTAVQDAQLPPPPAERKIIGYDDDFNPIYAD